jgi:S-adenosylmethionine decarboxylase
MPHLKSNPGSQTITIGRHLIIELSNASRLDEKQRILEVISAIADVIGATKLRSVIHDFGEGHGITGLLLLAESHISIHTWPEHEYAAVDIFMCGQGDIYRSVTVLESYFPEADIEHRLLTRGVGQK